MSHQKPGWIYLVLISVFLAADGFWGYKLNARIYDFKTFAVKSVQGDKILGFPRHVGITKSGPLVARLVHEIEITMDKNASFTVLPEGVTLNYLTRRKTPMPYLSFMPTELARRGDSEVVRAFEQAMPDYIVLTPKNPAEFGVGLFGLDPRNGLVIMQWVNEHYDVVWREGEEYGSHPEMRSVIYKRSSRKGSIATSSNIH